MTARCAAHVKMTFYPAKAIHVVLMQDAYERRLAVFVSVYSPTWAMALYVKYLEIARMYTTVDIPMMVCTRLSQSHGRMVRLTFIVRKDGR